MGARVRFFLFIGIVLFATSLADLSLPKIVPIVPAVTQLPVVESKSLKVQNEKAKTGTKVKIKVKKFVADPLDDLDREAFLASFQRQAKQHLLACLRSSWMQGSILLSGSLSRNGQFRRVIRFGDRDENLPECANSAITNMNFVKQTAGFRSDAIEVQWRVDF
jgi:hypothetical protein